MSDESDDILLARLGEAVTEAGIVTDRDRELARSAFAWKAVQAEVLELLRDSAIEAGAGVRASAPTVRDLTFAVEGVRVELEVGAGIVNGQVLGALDVTVLFEQPGTGERSAVTDADGFFEFDQVSPGPMRLTVLVSGGRFSSSWLTI